MKSNLLKENCWPLARLITWPKKCNTFADRGTVRMAQRRHCHGAMLVDASVKRWGYTSMQPSKKWWGEFINTQQHPISIFHTDALCRWTRIKTSWTERTSLYRARSRSTSPPLTRLMCGGNWLILLGSKYEFKHWNHAITIDYFIK